MYRFAIMDDDNDDDVASIKLSLTYIVRHLLSLANQSDLDHVVTWCPDSLEAAFINNTDLTAVARRPCISAHFEHCKS